MVNHPSFRVRFKEESKPFSVNLVYDETLALSFGEVQPITEIKNLYEGEYTVTPKMILQSLPTRDKVLVEDVKIEPVPVYRVSNAGGGITVYIASELFDGPR